MGMLLSTGNLNLTASPPPSFVAGLRRNVSVRVADCATKPPSGATGHLAGEWLASMKYSKAVTNSGNGNSGFLRIHSTTQVRLTEVPK